MKYLLKPCLSQNVDLMYECKRLSTYFSITESESGDVSKEKISKKKLTEVINIAKKRRNITRFSFEVYLIPPNEHITMRMMVMTPNKYLYHMFVNVQLQHLKFLMHKYNIVKQETAL